jgi:phage shock protein E
MDQNKKMNVFKNLFGSSVSADLENIIKEGAYLVDVRTPGEFTAGNIKGSVNIPLDKVSIEITKFRNKKNIIVFCQSGARSSKAKTILEQNGFTNVVNGGSWANVGQFLE